MKCNWNLPLIIILAVITGIVVFLGASSDEIAVIKIGAVLPLSGEAGESFGISSKNIIEFAVADVNKQWQTQNRRLEVVFADGACNPDDALVAAKQLVEQEGVKVIVGGGCSGETLGIAPFAEENQILLFSPLSTSNEITEAGDFIFRNVPSNGKVASPLVDFINEEGYDKVALLTENTSYAQDIRSIYVNELTTLGVTVVADELTITNPSDVTEATTTILAELPDVVVLTAQTVATAELFGNAVVEQGFTGQVIGNENFVISTALETNSFEGFVVPQIVFATENTPEFTLLREESSCNAKHYCAIAYDGIILLAELFEVCGDNTICLRDALYGTQNWTGPYYGTVSFDENGDVEGLFTVNRIVKGMLRELR